MKLRRALQYALFSTILYVVVLWIISLFGVNLVVSKNFWKFLPAEILNLNISRWHDLVAFFVVILSLYFVINITRSVESMKGYKLFFFKCLLISLYLSLLFILFFGFLYGLVFSFIAGLGSVVILTMLICILFCLGYIVVNLGKIILSILIFLGKVVLLMFNSLWDIIGSFLGVENNTIIE